MSGVKIGDYTYYKSTRPSKKLMVKVENTWIHFGDSSMEHYQDKTGIWKHLDHLDKDRRSNYQKRAKGIRNINGKNTWTNPNSANFHSYHILW
jgi:hypothetical protein